MTQTTTTVTPSQKMVTELRTVEISFYDHEIYCGTQLIATISYDHDLTQPWVVMVNGEEIHRANTFKRCHSYITWHYNRGTLPVQQPETPTATTGNKVMVQIAQECEKYNFEVLDDGIYHHDQKLGEVGCTYNNSQLPSRNSQLNPMPESKKPCTCNDSIINNVHNCELRTANCELHKIWWVIRASSMHQQKVPCDSTADAVWSLSMIEVTCDEDLLDRPFDQLTAEEWRRLVEYQPESESRELVAA
ncbi:hypothetical protein FNW02_34405 [Komarekiella sp. 'clone 1']|uniref:Uncharacterized protein n=1 Tax=Komarekiella delphini-convector SJRDD-AB1 TaxID=2593771 RepID=A0AA40T4D4_9NOST|nr:hypothetical protein [Komarekiella delphini-convector]MBD6620718.1 hypothetical protein [Komarekiella delphini-convector SJRDD-AB1]